MQDKVTINTLSMIADDYKDSLASANKLYQILRQRLLRSNSGIASSNNTTGGAELLLPVLYVLDSVLKNCRGCYVRIVQNDAATWMPAVYRRLDAAGRGKLQKVWRTWHEFRLFDDDGANNGAAQWREMGRCFTDGGGGGGSHNDKAAASATAAASASSGPAPQMPAVVAGIARTVRACVSACVCVLCVCVCSGRFSLFVSCPPFRPKCWRTMCCVRVQKRGTHSLLSFFVLASTRGTAA